MTNLEHTTRVVADVVEYIRGETDAHTARIVTGRLRGDLAVAVREVERQEQALREQRAIAGVYKKGLDDLNLEGA